MSEAISAVDSDYARVSAASLQLAAALAAETSSTTATPGDIALGQAAVQAAEANLEQAQAALEADQSAAASAATTASASSPTTSTTTSTTAAAAATAGTPAASADVSSTQHVTDPGGIVA